MVSKYSLNNVIHKLHLDGFIKSQKRFLKDNCGGFLIPIEAKIKDKEFARYRHLPINWSISPITKWIWMNDLDCRGNPVYVSRDAGYSKIKSISPENRRKVRERMNNPDIVTGNYKLKELYEKLGAIVHPERMTNWYPY